jgi:two-component sensor histidine kinase
VSRRLHALSVNQDLLIECNWRGAELSKIVQSQLAPLIEDHRTRVEANGPTTIVSPAAAQAISMAVYELAANALKYGALSVPAGRVQISWGISDVNGSRDFRLSWVETGGPPASPPRKKGFGSTIIENMVARSLLGKAELKYTSTGLSWKLVAPETALIAHPISITV